MRLAQEGTLLELRQLVRGHPAWHVYASVAALGLKVAVDYDRANAWSYAVQMMQLGGWGLALLASRGVTKVASEEPLETFEGTVRLADCIPQLIIQLVRVY